jgi:hypothetical protein
LHELADVTAVTRVSDNPIDNRPVFLDRHRIEVCFHEKRPLLVLGGFSCSVNIDIESFALVGKKQGTGGSASVVVFGVKLEGLHGFVFENELVTATRGSNLSRHNGRYGEKDEAKYEKEGRHSCQHEGLLLNEMKCG